MKNILITSAGKRVALVKAFKEAAARQGCDTQVLTTDMNPQMAPAAYVSDGCIQVPRVTDADYPQVLLRLCKERNVGMIVPTIDTELMVLADCKKMFAENGVSVIVSDESFIATCRDKRNTVRFLAQRNIKTPQAIDKHKPTFPMFAKPYDGSLSTNIHLIKSADELTTEILNDSKLMFMEYVDKTLYKEYTVDMYYGMDNKVKSIIPRERIEIRAGEINKGRTSKNYLVEFLKERLNYINGCFGCICIQLFFDERTSDVIGIEINPRFGGGYPLSYMAGGDYPSFLIREYFKNERIEYTYNWKDNMLMLRYDDAVFI